MLKLRWETAVTDPKAYYEIPFGVMERPADGEEEPGQTWIALRGAAFGAAMVNDCKYSFSMKEGDLNLTAIRSPYYNDHARGDQQDPESELSDQGETEFSYAMRAMDPAEGWGRLVREAHAFNTPCTAILDYNHRGTLPTSACGLSLSAENVELSALKRREDDRGWVVRLYETDGKETPFTLSGSLLPLPLTDTLPPFHARTYTLPDGAAAWQPVLMTEWEA